LFERRKNIKPGSKMKQKGEGLECGEEAIVLLLRKKTGSRGKMTAASGAKA